eukprot:CAMPEP_0170070236 /NCGR_PEP_ID=MMETSP0019_2-20121128/8609_1 /TAXON_ID=98059 /ORGANISM="Dinobryon sp., Strain UTEXLB2267" /LENGTH=172 /DNA_ID=CAMNT_0010278475 /DNA_START=117 /DNA_END=635 /DNA_ORIENTATION=+
MNGLDDLPVADTASAQFFKVLYLKEVRERERERQDRDKLETVYIEQILASRGVLTARGIFEHILNIIHIELKLPGKFNATTTCYYLQNHIEDLSGTPLQYTKGFLDAIHSCRFDAKSIVPLYSELSSSIHGAPWSGPGVSINVQILSGGANGASACLLLKIADMLKLPLAAK